MAATPTTTTSTPALCPATPPPGRQPPIACKAQVWWHNHSHGLIAAATSPAAITGAAAVALVIVWVSWRQSAIRRGKDVPSFAHSVGGWLRFTVIDDSGRWRLASAAGFAVAAASWLLGSHTSSVVLTAALLAVGLLRWRAVWSARRRVLAQMLNIAAAHLRYPRPQAAARPTGRKTANKRRPRPSTATALSLRASEWIEVAGWHQGGDGDMLPGRTVVRYLPAFGAGSGKARERFEEQWSVAISPALEWTYEWNPAANAVTCVPSPALPPFVPWRADPEPVWNRFPLGMGSEGVIHWDVELAPHCLVAGPTGSGKSVAQRVIVAHALLANWQVVGLDPKRVELSWLRDQPGVVAVATDFDEMAKLVRAVEALMVERLEKMERGGVNHFRLLADPPPPLLFMVDEVTEFLSLTGLQTEEAQEQDAIRAMCATKIQSVARLGRAAGIHLCLATQRPDAAMGFSGNLKNNIDARVACGRMDDIPSRMILDSDAARWIPPIKGRGLLRQCGTLARVQMFYAEGDDVTRAAGQRAGSDGPEEPAWRSPTRAIAASSVSELERLR